jgi:hypothetical protein
MSRKRRNRSEIGALLDGADSNESVLSDSESAEVSSPPPASTKSEQLYLIRGKRVRGINGIYEKGDKVSLHPDEVAILVQKQLVEPL